nr:helix-turn-helix domain-containing protein [uncultured Cupriavidus sp.]
MPINETLAPMRATTASAMPIRAERAGPQDDLHLIAGTLDVVGDTWTLLIVREALAGATRFGQFQRRIGIGPNILSARLRLLIEHGVLESKVCAERADWSDYVLTRKGRKLQAVLDALRHWGTYAAVTGQE